MFKFQGDKLISKSKWTGFNQAMQTVSLESLIFVLNLPYSAMIMWRVKHFHSLQSWLNSGSEIYWNLNTDNHKPIWIPELIKILQTIQQNRRCHTNIPSYQKISQSWGFFSYTEHVPSIMNSFPPSIYL